MKTRQIDFSILVLGAIVLILFSMASCRAGYGCRGTKSWNGVVWKANKFN